MPKPLQKPKPTKPKPILFSNNYYLYNNYIE